MRHLPTPAPVKYKADGQPSPPAPTINTDEFFKFCWPEMQLLAIKIKMSAILIFKRKRQDYANPWTWWCFSGIKALIFSFFVCVQINLFHQDHDLKPPIVHLQALPHRYRSIPLPNGSYLILVTPAHLSAIWIFQPQLTMWTDPGHACVH